MLDRGAPVHDDVEPGRGGDPRRLPVHDPELEPQAAGADSDRLLGVREAQLRPPEDVDDVDRTGRPPRLR